MAMIRFQSHVIRGPKTMWCFAAGADKPKMAKPVFEKQSLEEYLASKGVKKWHCSNCGEQGR